MPDLAMCLSSRCTRRHTCLRYLSSPTEGQSYAYFPLEDCAYHLPAEGRKVRTLEEADAAALRAQNTRNVCGND
jgi:hypothetical protein